MTNRRAEAASERLDADGSSAVGSTAVMAHLAQLTLARLDPGELSDRDLAVDGEIFPELDLFVPSKASISVSHRRIRPTSFAVMHQRITGLPRQLLIKNKSGEAIDRAFTSNGEPALSHGRAPVSDLHRLVVDAVERGLTDDERAARTIPPAAVDIEPDVEWDSGPHWLEASEPTAQVVDGRLVLRAHTLYVLSTHPGPGHDKFKGNHYCTVAAPEFVRHVILTGSTG